AGLALVVGIVPWTQIEIVKSPFAHVFQSVGIPAAGHIMNFVVLTAALSSAVANLYFAARLAFSLARAVYLTRTLGRLNKNRLPLVAVLVAGAGMAPEHVPANRWPDSLFVPLIAGSTF